MDLTLTEDVRNISMELVTLNLRGTLMVVPRTAADTFPTSTLSRALRDVLRPCPPRDDAGNLYFNRNPALFHLVLDVIVNDYDAELLSLMEPADRAAVERELVFWGLRVKRLREEETHPGNVMAGNVFGMLPQRRFGDAVVIPPRSSVSST